MRSHCRWFAIEHDAEMAAPPLEPQHAPGLGTDKVRMEAWSFVKLQVANTRPVSPIED